MERFFVHKSQLQINPVDALFETVETSDEQEDRPYWNYEPPLREVKQD
jgi:hypothetical protein